MNIPEHIAIIMDGNGRWALEKGLARTQGHKRGAERVKEIVAKAQEIGVKSVTIFAFSTENWSRPEKELKALFFLLKLFLDSNFREMKERGVKFKVIGRRDRLPADVLEKIDEVETGTAVNNDFIFNIAIDYGGRWDIVNAAKNVCRRCVDGEIDIESINEEFFGKYMQLNYVKEPDLLIRTSGEQRISNFLIWDCAYSEFYFSPLNWPDFTADELVRAIEDYSKRDRRFGNHG
ncbi:MAG: isoprenyl transferase [Candidatus Omnitrophica bacterium]|nr:isoprenyl transferase [Candidatus Omnitrophota bacterium]MDD5440749.1 isoprenyl transferase [Candidatus Omnitrophota bacterium]